VLSIALTMAAYLSVVNDILTGKTLIMVIVGLAVAQLLVQLLFFLHLGNEAKPRWNLVIFLFMVLVLSIVVGGSLWIMNNLDYNMMPHEMHEYMLEEEGIR
jgi:cytochrome o ubiquinol oxidase operon protein cyoD